MTSRLNPWLQFRTFRFVWPLCALAVVSCGADFTVEAGTVVLDASVPGETVPASTGTVDEPAPDSGPDFVECGLEYQCYLCASGIEIPLDWTCDGEQDCVSGDDEAGCFACVSEPTTMLPGDFRCDLIPDCSDGSDELDCPAADGGVAGAAGSAGAPQAGGAGGNSGSGGAAGASSMGGGAGAGGGGVASAGAGGAGTGGSGGENLEPILRGCDRGEPPERCFYECDSGQRILQELLCDGMSDCPEHEDERGCFECESSGTRFPASLHCNNTLDCADGTDEDWCP